MNQVAEKFANLKKYDVQVPSNFNPFLSQTVRTVESEPALKLIGELQETLSRTQARLLSAEYTGFKFLQQIRRLRRQLKLAKKQRGFKCSDAYLNKLDQQIRRVK